MSFSDGDYSEMSLVDGRTVFVAKELTGISNKELSSALNGQSKRFLLVGSGLSSTLQLKEVIEPSDERVVVILRSNSYAVLVGSSISTQLDGS